MSIASDYKKLIKELGKSVRVQINVSMDTFCGSCDYNPILRQSTNPQCPVCGGTGKISQLKKVIIPAIVQYGTSIGVWQSGGIKEESLAQVYVDSKSIYYFRKYLENKKTLLINNVEYDIIEISKTIIYTHEFTIFNCRKREK